MIVQTDGVVLHAMKYRDTSKIVTLYTKKFGKIKVVAKGVRSQKNKFGSSLEPMTISSIVVYKKEHKDLHLLAKSEIALSLSSLHDNSERMFTGLALIELVNMMMHDEEENEAVYAMLVQALTTINETEKNHVNVLLSFMLKLFERFGFGLSIRECSVCKRSIENMEVGSAILRLSDGKIICSDCAGEHTISGTQIDGGMVKSLYYLHVNEIQKAPLLTLASAMKNEIIATLQSYLRYHIESARTLKSLSLLYSTQ